MSFKSLIVLFIISLVVSSCYTKKLKDGEYLLDKNKIITNNDKVDKDELSSIIKQRPNKKIFSFVKFHLMLHNSMDSAKVANRELHKIKRRNKRIVRKNRRIKNKNKRREKKNDKIEAENRGLEPKKQSDLKKIKDTIKHLAPETFDSFGEKILYSIGEAPVVYNKESSETTADQLHLFLIRKGFFNNTVKDSVIFPERKFLGISFGVKKKRAEVEYIIHVEDPYTLNSITLRSEDSALLKKLKMISSNSKLKTNTIFDIDKMDDERERITEYLLNDGYYKFTKNYIKFYIDSAIGGNKVDVIVSVDLFKSKERESDSIIQMPHRQYTISRVRINYTQDRTSNSTSDFIYKGDEGDKGVEIFVRGKNDINANLFYRSLFLKPGDLYSKQKQQQMFRKLTSLGVFKSVNIITELDSIENTNQLILNIRVSGADRQEIKYEGNGTTSGSNFGIEGTVEYNHKNIFRGAEVFHVGISGSIESQPLFVNDNTDDNSNIPIDIQSFSNISSAFNTVEFGPEMSLTIPSLLFFNTNKFENVSNTRTIFSASLNYQRRLDKTKLDFERGIQELSFGYAWRVKNRFQHQLDPISLSAVEVAKSQDFEDRINSLNDKLLAASFQNHIISATRYRFVYNDPTASSRNRFTFYYDGTIESAGNTLNAFYKLTNQTRDPLTDAFNIVGIQFAQYIKTQHDFRMYHKINDKNSFVFRFLTGVGVPMENLSDALPFEKSFFAGGTDKNRAWKARSLGPGSYRDSVLRFDKIGEILLEGNVEYRFDLLGFLDGALFVDAGNIWLMNPDSLRPGSQFKFNTFSSQIAIGAGFGIRIDLDFFLFRFDVAYPLKNPSLIEGERWFFQPKDEYNSYLNTLKFPENAPRLYPVQFNFGIGYPF